MKQLRRYDGIDLFRMVAAIMIVAIHTYPLFSVNETSNTIFVHVILRIAVPFFLMTTGFFLIPKLFLHKHSGFAPIKKFIVRTSIIYMIATVIYLPIAFYSGAYNDGNLVANLLRNLLVDGTFYHLWYLPGAITGVLVVYLLSRVVSVKGSAIIAGILYVICLLGDSYYGIFSGLPVISSFYGALFQVFTYTRNGFFYAPMFLMLGCILSLQLKGNTSTQSTNTLPRWKCITNYQCILVGLLISSIVFITEGILLMIAGSPRHDASYIALIPTMYFLFLLIEHHKGERSPFFRDTSLWIYIIHPLMIILLRGIARPLGLWSLMVDNSIMRFLLVTLMSLIGAGLISYVIAYITNPKYQTGRAWIEVDMHALDHNIRELRSILPPSCDLMPAVKANAYGHGAVIVSRRCNQQGIRSFCVATVMEGVELRKQRIRGDILILGYTHPEHFHLLHRYRLMQTVVDLEYARDLHEYGKKIKVHIAVDTGMKRLGEHSDMTERFLSISRLSNLEVEGIFSHFSGQSEQFSDLQMQRFDELVHKLKQEGVKLPKVHMQSSYGVFHCPDSPYDYARVGIVLYGAMEGQNEEGRVFKPVMSLKTRVSMVKKVKAGEAIGYGNAYFARQDMKIAVLTIGYADGVKRDLSCGVGSVLIHGQKAIIVGLICMDQMMVDISHISHVKQGDIATLIGVSGDLEISAVEMANQVESIPNDILSSLGVRIERIVK